ncbi:helix-turn-helix transcriptional regulator [Palleronia rufa]|uniref:helix-turn-helix transcriptional regulator n=1 Tax=Palleronia rufa TaxID=1530186 RepID=UPI0012691B85|nr:AlpA family phage regulatory protein [Palleronia rufa]
MPVTPSQQEPARPCPTPTAPSACRSTLYREIAEGAFPAQLRISVHGAGWRESEIDRWVADPVGWRPEGEGR